MTPKSVHTEAVTIAISGKDIKNPGVEAFVFIEIDGWIDGTRGWKGERRNAVIHKNMGDVWKSLTASGHRIRKMTTCMTLPNRILSFWSGWAPPVDVVFNESPRTWCHFGKWAKVFLSDKEAIVLVSVSDDCKLHAGITETVQAYSTTLAVHQLTYPNVAHIPDMAREIFKRDPEGTVTIWKKPGRPQGGLLYLKD